MTDALCYAREACDTLIRKFAPEKLPPEGKFHYHQGVFLSSMLLVWRLTRERKYFDYLKAWVDSLIDDNGHVICLQRDALDDIEPGVLLFALLKETGDERYKKALDELLPIVRDFPRAACGGFFHKHRYPHQMWLDGLYMGGPICAMYAELTGETGYFDLVIEQARLMKKYTFDGKTGLWRHAYDDVRVMPWADPETGKSPEFWGRSVGWVGMALLDDLEHIPAAYPGRDDLIVMLRDLLVAVAKYQDEETGLWYQVIDKGGQAGNWLESSCTCLFAAAMYRAVKAGYVDSSLKSVADRAYDGIIRRLRRDDNGLIIDNICIGTGVGDYAHYCARPTSQNDLHGAGAFTFLCCYAAMSGR